MPAQPIDENAVPDKVLSLGRSRVCINVDTEGNRIVWYATVFCDIANFEMTTYNASCLRKSFSEKNELPQVGFKSYSLEQVVYQLSH